MHDTFILRSRARRWLLVLGWLLMGAGPAAARPPAPPAVGPGPRAYLRQFGPTEGLRQPFVYCLLQDRQGYLWLGTAEGLVRYDGRRFRTYTTADGLAENFVTGLWQDPATGALWATHERGGRSIRGLEDGPFRPAGPARAGEPASQKGPSAPDTARLGAYQRRYQLHLPKDVVLTCLLEDREGNAWLGTAGQGLWQHADRHLSQWPRPETPATPARPPVRLVRPTALGGGYWRVNSLGTLQTHDAAGQPTGTVPGLPTRLGSAVSALAYAPGSGLWVGTVADGLYLVPAAQPGAAAPTTQHFTTANGLLHNGIVTLLADRRGRVWVGTHHTGLAVWEPAASRFRYERLSPGGLDVNALAQDAAGTIWVGTEGQGLYRQSAGATGWQHLTQASGALPDDYLTALLPLPASLPASLPAPLAGALLLVHPRGLSLLRAGDSTAHPIAGPDNPLVADLLPGATLTANAPNTQLSADVPTGAGDGARPAGAVLAWLPTRTGWLRLDLAELARVSPPGPAAPPGLALVLADADGEIRPAHALGELPAGRHRVSFLLEGLSLTPGASAGLEYRYRLRGLNDEWTRPGPADDAQFAGLGPGQYVLEAQARRAGTAGNTIWSPPVRAAFSVATPWWQRPWVLALAALALAGGLLALVRARERVLRGQRNQLERTVRSRTDELRQKNQAIERINGELRLARDAADSSRRAKAQFLANMSHEIRTPMNAIVGLTNLLRYSPTTPEQTEYLTAIGGSSQNLLVILNDILDSSKMEAGKLTLEQVPFRLPELVRGLQTLFRYAADSQDLELRVEVAPAVPTAVLGDPVRLQQVLVNLVSNALKFTRQGSVWVRVDVVTGPTSEAGSGSDSQPATLPLAEINRQEANNQKPTTKNQPIILRFEVEDTGIGIAPEQQAAIFEDFAQANASTTREYGGTGLGLSIARHLVGLHGGQLAVRSAPGRGSVFYFELRYAVADAALAPATAALAGPLPAFEPALRVLVAEDNALNQLVARKTLENWNVRVVIADNGRLAVEAALAAAAAAEPFDAVLMDIQMPELDGYGATRALRRHFPDAARLPVIGLTASVLPEERSLALAAGMSELLPKPFEPAVLHARLAHFTGRAALTAGPLAGAEADDDDDPLAPPRPDWRLLEELSGHNPAFIEQIINIFLAEAPALEVRLAAAGPHDPATMAALAHKLKGQVAYFGVPGLHARLEALEAFKAQARPPGGADCAALLADVRQQLSQLYPALRARLGK